MLMEINLLLTISSSAIKKTRSQCDAASNGIVDPQPKHSNCSNLRLTSRSGHHSTAAARWISLRLRLRESGAISGMVQGAVPYTHLQSALVLLCHKIFQFPR